MKRDALTPQSSFPRTRESSEDISTWVVGRVELSFSFSRDDVGGESGPTQAWGARLLRWIPAFAGMTTYGCGAADARRRQRMSLPKTVATFGIATRMSQMSYVDAAYLDGSLATPGLESTT
ncbi:MAG: hypothetical protein ABIQ99_08260, partial [Thermoflexales bacterium]